MLSHSREAIPAMPMSDEVLACLRPDQKQEPCMRRSPEVSQRLPGLSLNVHVRQAFIERNNLDGSTHAYSVS
jgi:hypothetical protein